jgi:hypothetical protein
MRGKHKQCPCESIVRQALAGSGVAFVEDVVRGGAPGKHSQKQNLNPFDFFQFPCCQHGFNVTEIVISLF